MGEKNVGEIDLRKIMFKDTEHKENFINVPLCIIFYLKERCFLPLLGVNVIKLFN